MPDPPSPTDPTSSTSPSVGPNIKLISATYQQTIVSSPFLHPEILRQYEAIQPGFADRLIKMAEVEGEHRRNQESKTLDANIKAVEREQEEVKRGQNYGLTIAIIAILSGLIAAFNGAQWFGVAIGAGGVAGLASVFVYKQRQSEKTK